MDFNRACLSATPINTAINQLIEAAATREPESNVRQYLGASAIGSDCLRKVQFDWLVDPAHSFRLRDIFRRGHIAEALSKQHLLAAGFHFAPAERLGFSAVGGLFRGHADGIVVAGPAELPGVGYPCVWEHKCLGAKGWRSIERDGLVRSHPQYAAQVWLYQAYLSVADHPAIVTVVNADSCERLHLLLPFDSERAQAWSDRAVTVVEATRAGELLPRFTDDPEDWRCRMCGHRKRCWGMP